jgi:hypothetical protein
MTKLLDGGNDAGRLNVVALAEGYTEAERLLFEQHAKQLAAVIKSEPWYRHGLLNLHALFVASRQSARTLKAKGGHLDTAFKAEYGQGTRAGHVLSGDDEEAKRHAADSVFPPEKPIMASMHVIVLTNCTLYGGKGGGEGGGICWSYTDKFNPQRWTACALHEYGHVLGLADEYGTADGPPLDRTSRTKEPREPNLTLDPRGAKWRHLVTGAVEGADGYNRGIYRPTRDCRMRSFAGGFCRVCSDHISRELEGYLTEEPVVEPEEPEKPEEPEPGDGNKLNIQAIERSGNYRNNFFDDNSAGCMEAVQWLLKRQFG